MPNYLLEMGCEEIPARFVPKLLLDLKNSLTKQLTDQRIGFDEIETLGTYRRLTLIIKNIADQTQPLSQLLRGPIASVAFDLEGNLTPAGLGFLKRYQLAPEAAISQTENGKDYLFAKQEIPAQPTAILLGELVLSAIKSIELPVAMKWGNGVGPFVRPLHWMVSLLDDQVIPFELFEIAAGRVSYGHRLLTENPNPAQIISGCPIILPNADTYAKALLDQGKVITSHIERDITIRKALGEIAQNPGYADLLEEVVWITENPSVLQGEFSATYLSIPQEVIIETMVKNQRYFPQFSNEKLSNSFLVVCENVSPQNADIIRAGNERVLKARLDDAKYFWEEDCKTTLESKRDRLKTVTFQKGLGSVYEKSERLERLSAYLSEKLGITDSTMRADIQKTAQLCKADLTTHMVYEFGSLQGIMGGIYVAKDGESALVAQGIREHYGISSCVPGMIVGLTDRLDTIAACFSNNLIPTGSQDPWGVRRAIYSIIEQITHPLFPNQQGFSIRDWIQKAFDILGKDQAKLSACLSFILDRASVGAAFDHYVLDDYFKAKSSSLAVSEFKNEDQLKLLCETAVRVQRIVKNAPDSRLTSEILFQESIEKEAFQTYKKTQPSLDGLIQLSSIMTQYFEDIMVNHEDPSIKSNRLAFMRNVADLYLSFADFEKLK